MCDSIGDSGTDDIFAPGLFEHSSPFAWSSLTTGTVPPPFDITRAMTYFKSVEERKFLIWGIEYLPFKIERSFVFEFNQVIMNFTNGSSDPFRRHGDLLLFVHFKPHEGFIVEFYVLRFGDQFTKKDLVFRKFIPCSEGAVGDFVTVATNHRVNPAAPWGGVINTALTKEVNEPYSFFEGKVDLTAIRDIVGEELHTNFVFVRSLEPFDNSDLFNCRLRDRVGPAKFKIRTRHHPYHSHSVCDDSDSGDGD
jgi:hypothetical protein